LRKDEIRSDHHAGWYNENCGHLRREQVPSR
jgi:hypothetical protein